MASLPEHLMPISVGRERLPRKVLIERQRGKVLDAAVEIFAKRGYRGTTVDHLVSGAGVGVGSFYSLFDSKEDCFLAVYDRTVAEGRERIAAALPARASWPQRLATGLWALLETIEAQPFAARIALIEVQTAGARALSQHQRNLDEAAELLRPGREYAPASVELPASLEFATIGGLTWFLQQRIAIGEAGKATELLPEVLEIAAEPYLGEAATAALSAPADGGG
jgi:AcrR family transcriptional regulator